jgi:prepilin-type N-terminal cleavage/methylation domain-containing protein
MRKPYLSRHDGFTLIELIIAMVAFMLVIIIAAKAFEKAIATSRVVSKSEESNIEGVVGLEMLRHDLEQAGFGLFTNVDSTLPVYSEAAASATQAAVYNDSPSGVPRAIIAGNNLNVSDDTQVLNGTDYLVIKASTLGLSKSSLKWTYISYSSASYNSRFTKSWPGGDNLTDGVDKVIVVSQVYKDGMLKRKLVYNNASTSSWARTYNSNGSYGITFVPAIPGQQYFYYGVGSTTPRAPFNRADYLVKKVTSDMSKVCAPGAGSLYKAVMNQTDGTMTNPILLLDCVADMQVVLGWNTAATPGQSVDTYTDPAAIAQSGSGTVIAASLTDPDYIRTRLKLIKVYILAQDGAYDKNFKNSSTPLVVGDPNDSTLTRSINLSGANYQNYRWKLYRVVVRPKNIN